MLAVLLVSGCTSASDTASDTTTDADQTEQVYANARQLIGEIQKGQAPFGYFARNFSEASTRGVNGDAGAHSGVGAASAMSMAVEDAGVSAADIVHVNAHATSTPVGDIAESKAIRRAFGDEADHMAVSGTKSLTGHLLGGAGAVESVFTVMALHDRTAPATANIETFDEAIQLDVVRDAHRDLPAGQVAALNNSFGFGGHNVAVVFGSAS